VPPAHPRVLFIAGARRHAGKTLVSSLILRSLPGMGAIKVTCCRAETSCPRDKPCGVCRALSGPFDVIQDHATLAMPGKDTARLLEAATGRVVWLQSRPSALGDALDAALSVFDEEPAVLVEGNAAFQTRRPDVGVLVIGPGPEPAKESVRPALPAVSGVVLNARPGSPPPVMIEGLPGDVRVFSFDAAHPEGSDDARALVEWLADRLGAVRGAAGDGRTARR